MFLFQISNYENPALEAETAELLRQRLEAQSRQSTPGLWKATDKLSAYAAQGPGREKRRKRRKILGFLLLFLGVFALVPGLMPPRNLLLSIAGGVGILAGLLALLLGGRQKPTPIPESCRQEAKELLEKRRAVDWSKIPAKLRFDEEGMEISIDDRYTTVPREQLHQIFETDRLYLILYEEDGALLLQKKDMISGIPQQFIPYFTKGKKT